MKLCMNRNLVCVTLATVVDVVVGDHTYSGI